MHKNVKLIFLTVLCLCMWTMAIVSCQQADAASPASTPSVFSHVFGGSQPAVKQESAFPVKYPARTRSMTDREFFKWATDRNAKATEAWFNEASLSPQYITTKVRVTKTNASTRAAGNSGTTVDGYTALPKRASGTSTHETYEYNRRYVNPNHSWPGPLTIINPYVRPK